jgi:CheY-like chemotaxis protein
MKPMHDLRALVVDDSKVGRLTMMKKLEAMGMKVELAESGPQALDYLAQHRPDIIFMDHMMPEMDGFEVTRRIKASPATRSVPVIIISGNDDAAFIQEARAAGAVDAIAKPPAAGVLEALLASLPERGDENAAEVAEPAAEPDMIAPALAPAMDMTAVQAMLERLVASAVAPLRDDFLTGIGKRFELESDNQYRTLTEWGRRLDQQAETMAEFRRGAADVEAHGNRLLAVEQRLIPLEAEAGRPLPDLDALQASMDQRVESLAVQMESLRRDLQTREADHANRVEQRVAGWGGRLDKFAEEFTRLSGEVRSMQSDHAESLQRMEQRIAQTREALEAAWQAAVPVPGGAGEEVASSELQAELAELRASLSDTRLRQRVADHLDSLQPPAERLDVARTAQPDGILNLQAEVARLRSKLKTVVVVTAAGGALLLALIGLLVFGN